MRRKQQKVIVTPGTIVKEWLKCGRPWCKCATSNYRHGPYYFLRWREYMIEPDGKVVRRQCKRYIAKCELARERARLGKALSPQSSPVSATNTSTKAGLVPGRSRATLTEH